MKTSPVPSSEVDQHVIARVYDCLPGVLRAELYSICRVASSEEEVLDRMTIVEDVLWDFIAPHQDVIRRTERTGRNSIADRILETQELMMYDFWVGMDWDLIKQEINNRLFGLSDFPKSSESYMGRGGGGPRKKNLGESPIPSEYNIVSEKVNNNKAWIKFQDTSLKKSYSCAESLSNSPKQKAWLKKDVDVPAKSCNESPRPARKVFEPIEKRYLANVEPRDSVPVKGKGLKYIGRQRYDQQSESEFTVNTQRTGYTKMIKAFHNMQPDLVPSGISDSTWRLLKWDNFDIACQVIDKHDMGSNSTHIEFGTPCLLWIKSVLEGTRKFTLEEVECCTSGKKDLPSLTVLLKSLLTPAPRDCIMAITPNVACNKAKVLATAKMSALDVLTIAVEDIALHGDLEYYNYTTSLLRILLKFQSSHFHNSTIQFDHVMFPQPKGTCTADNCAQG